MPIFGFRTLQKLRQLVCYGVNTIPSETDDDDHPQYHLNAVALALARRIEETNAEEG